MTTPTFQMGAETYLDKSLDDIIKERNKERRSKSMENGQSARRSGPRRPAHRQNFKEAGQNQTHVKPTPVDKSIGKNKASRSAKLAARRGLQTSDQPTPMEIDKEVYRQQRSRTVKRVSTGGGGATAAVGGTPNPARRRRKKVNITSMVTDGSGKKNPSITTNTVMGKKLPTERTTSGPPPKKAVEAAVMAMSKAGYQPPKGMKMEIRFVEKK